ncbi:hypothetical protein FCV25MIE_19952 [Fagus crenata]
MKRLSRNPLSAVGRSQSLAWVRRSHLEDYEPPCHSLTLEPPRHSVSLEAPFHSLPLEPPFHSLKLEPPRPSFFTQTRRTESKSGILGRFRALFSNHSGGACHRKDKHTHEPTNEEWNMLQKVKEIGAKDELKISNVVKSNGRNYWNKNVSFGDRRYLCHNCPGSFDIYSCKRMKLHSKEVQADLGFVCSKCGTTIFFFFDK